MKKKSLRKVLAASVAAMLMCAPMMAVNTAYADGASEYSITLNNASGRTFKAYQIFKGTLSEETTGEGENAVTVKVLSSIKWSDETIGTTILSKLKESTVIGNKFDGCLTAEDVSKVLIANSSSADFLDAFAQIVDKNKGSLSGISAVSDVISPTEPGYYLVVDESKPLAGDARSRYILDVVGKVTVSPKIAVPTINKDVQYGLTEAGDPNWNDANTAGIGDTVNYRLTATVPDMTGYDTYYFVIDDKLSEGLNFLTDESGNVNFTVKVGTDDIALTTDKKDTGKTYYKYVVGNQFRIVFNNFKQYSKDAAIEITYSAVVNDKAKVGADTDNSNPNEVKLIYSNDPNYEYNGNKGPTDSPDDDKPYEPPMQDNPNNKTDTGNPSGGSTPDNPFDDVEPTDKPDPTGKSEDKVTTYTAEIILEKFDGAAAAEATEKHLNGAGFTLYKADGTTAIGSEQIVELGEGKNNGLLTFAGLGEGTYFLKETTVPNGYNKASDIKLVIKATPTLSSAGWSNDTTNGSDSSFSVNNGTYSIEVTNNKGSILPSTGGIGTTIFYVSGGVLVLGSVVLIITKKRMSLKDEK